MQILQQAMRKPRDPREQDVEIPPVTPKSVADAIEATRKERIRNGLDPETGKPLDGFGVLCGELQRFTADHPGVVVEFKPRPAPLPVVALRLDANGLPFGHEAAAAVAADHLADYLNELPGDYYHFGPTDAECAASRMILAYLGALKAAR